MERKIGEIKQINGEWYQCVEGRCIDCYFSEKRYICKQFLTKNFCASGIIFKKLEKVGEPYKVYEHLVQKYKFFHSPAIQVQGMSIVKTINSTNTIEIGIKQNKEGMEKKHGVSADTINGINHGIEPMSSHYKEDMKENTDINVEQTPLERLVIDFFNNRITDMEFERRVSELYVEHSNSENIGKDLKEFDIEAAKAGKPVCTRGGRKARIICFDAKYENDYKPIIALIDNGINEFTVRCTKDGECSINAELDLMMLTEKKEGWVNVYDDMIYSTKNEALCGRGSAEGYIDTVKVCWEE